MRIPYATVVPSIVALSVAQSVAAMDPPGQPMFQLTPHTREQGSLALRHMGACVFKADRGQSLALLRTVPGSRNEARIVEAMQSRLGQCFRSVANWIQFTKPALRGFVAEGAYLSFVPATAMPAAATVDGSSLPIAWIAAYRKDPSLGSALALHEFAGCVVRGSPAAVDKLVRTEPGSKEEAAAVGVLAPYLGACVNQGRNFKSDRPSLRAILAEALYHRVANTIDGSMH